MSAVAGELTTGRAVQGDSGGQGKHEVHVERGRDLDRQGGSDHPFVAPRPPWRNGEAETTSRREIEVIVARAVPVDVVATLAVVQEIALLATYEPKCTTLSLHPTAAGRGRYETAGRLLGAVRWRGWFDYTLDDTGFHSHTTKPIGGVAVAGGFRVESRGIGASVVTHYEQYLLPRGTRWLRRPWRRYVVRTIHAELSNIAGLAGEVAAVRTLPAHA